MKLANILLHNKTVVIADFGFAKFVPKNTGTWVGSWLTKAPEIYLGSK